MLMSEFIFINLVPLGVLSVLPGYGPTTGAEIVSHPLVRKVDITVLIYPYCLHPSLRLFQPLTVFCGGGVGWNGDGARDRVSRRS